MRCAAAEWQGVRRTTEVMKPIIILSALVALTATIPSGATSGDVDPCQYEYGADTDLYRGRDLLEAREAGGKRKPSEELEQILQSHEEWLKQYSVVERASSAAFHDPKRARLCGAILRNAHLFGRDLSYADLTAVDLEGADLNAAVLRHASLTGALLKGASIVGADVGEAFLGDADLTAVLYEPQPGQPHPIAIRRARNLEGLVFQTNPDALIELRALFRSAGRRDLERRVTYAIERSRSAVAVSDGRHVEAAFRWLAWEFPTRYDLEPERALKLFALLWLAFVPIYALALRVGVSPRIWRVLPRDRIQGDGQEVQEPVIAGGFRRWWLAAYFSFLSISRVGWRDLTIGTWISRLQRSEYDLRGLGWVRTLAGFESLVGFYLLALWALTYFGRLFDG